MTALGDGGSLVAGWYDGTLVDPEERPLGPAVAERGQPGPVRRAPGQRRERPLGEARGRTLRRHRTWRRVPRGRERRRVHRNHRRHRGRRGVRPGRGERDDGAVGAGPIYAALPDPRRHLSWVRFAGRGVPGQGYGVAHDRDRPRSWSPATSTGWPRSETTSPARRSQSIPRSAARSWPAGTSVGGCCGRSRWVGWRGRGTRSPSSAAKRSSPPGCSRARPASALPRRPQR